MTWLAILVALVLGGYVLGPPLLRALIRRRLGGYWRDANVVDPSRPERLAAPRTVAVVGGGLAGLTAALTLARRGFTVTVLEANPYLGGKVGSWQVELAPGRKVWVSHGFHAFFPHYVNLNRFLDSLGLRKGFRNIGDYVIVGPKDTVRFAGLDTTPVFNLLSLARAGVFSLADALKAPGRDLYGLFLEYEHDATFEKYDHLSFARFVEVAQVAPRLKLAFDTFARAFFADDDKLSLAELLKSFHFFYLGQDGGLLYDYPPRDYEAAFLEPWREALAALGSTVRLGARVGRLERLEGGGFAVDGERFDAVVMAADVKGASPLMASAAGLPPELTARFAKLKAGQRYAVLRVWLDKDLRQDLPVFVITDRVKVLDAVTINHRFEQETIEDLKAHGGGYVLELHCYAVPDALSEAEVREALVAELRQMFPEVKDAVIQHQVLQLKGDMTAFHVGLYKDRPTVETGVPGLYCAGDWVKLPFPAMLLECACASGVWAANGLLREAGLREEPVRSVPLKGLMAGMPQPPARKVLAP